MDQSFIKYLPRFIRTKIEGRHILQKSISNVGWLFADNVVRMGVGLFVSVWVARYLGPAKFGIYNYAIAFVTLFSVFSTLGLDGIVVRDIVRDPSSANETLGSAFVLKLIGGVLTLAFTVGIVSTMRPDDELTHWLVGIIAAGTVFQAFDVIDFWFQSQIKSKYTVYAKNTAFLLASIGKIGLILMAAHLIVFAWIGFAEVAMGALGLVIVYKINGLYIGNFTVTFRRVKDLLMHSWPLIFSSTFVLVNMQIDKIMIREISGDREIGYYAAASRLSELWYFVPVVLGASVVPVLIREKYRGDFFYNSQLQKIYNLMTMIALPLALLVTIFSKNIIEIIYGPGYSDASLMLSIHIWTALFVFHVSIRSQSFIIEGLQNLIALYALFTMASNVVLNLLLIPDYGGAGSAYASLFSWMISVILLPLFSQRTVKSVKMFFKTFNILSFKRAF